MGSLDDKKKLRYTIIIAILLFALMQCVYIVQANQNVFRKEEKTSTLCYQLIEQTLESYVEKPKIEVVSIQEKGNLIIAGYLLGEPGFSRNAGRLTFFLENGRYVLREHRATQMRFVENQVSSCTVPAPAAENGVSVEYLVVVSENPKLRAIALLDGTEWSEIAVEGNPSMTLVPLPTERGGDWEFIFD